MAEEEGKFLPPSATGELERGVRYELSPDGFVRIVFAPEERRNGEWWEQVSVYLAQRDRHLFSLPYFFEADVKWTGERTFALFAGKADASGSIQVDVDVEANRGKGRCVVAETGSTFRCADAKRRIERAYEAHLRSLPPVAAASAPAGYEAHFPPMATPLWRDPDHWRRTLLIGIIAAVMMAALLGGGYWWNEVRPQAPDAGQDGARRYPPPPKIKPVVFPTPGEAD
ncbi:MAG: hypothetical protein AAFZ11_01425 [Pseudomonadota bacterium]